MSIKFETNRFVIIECFISWVLLYGAFRKFLLVWN
jgi:hypothetical protein